MSNPGRPPAIFRIGLRKHCPGPLKHKRYALHWERRMTIAIGVLCDDGLVLGTDLQYTVGNAKWPGKKLWHFCPQIHPCIAISAAGNPNSAKRVIQNAEQTLLAECSGVRPTIGQIISNIEKALGDLYLNHIEPRPKEDQEDIKCWLLVAIRDGPGMRLFSNDRTQLIEEDDRVCTGSGFYFAYYALWLLLPDRPSVEVASQVVAYVIAVAKECADGVGAGSNVHMFYNGGRWDSLIIPERAKIETSFKEMLSELPRFIRCCDPRMTSDQEIDSCLSRMKEQMEKVRQLKRERDGRRIERAKRLADLPSRQSTKDDQSPSPPLPESPGGSGES